MSNEYTAEDFAQASFARHPDLGLATRDGGINGDLWMDINGDECDDSGMALYGWTPVMEVEDWERRIGDLTAAHDDVRRLLEGTADDLRHHLALTREELVDLREENRRLEAGAEDVVSLDGLRVAWEAAEVSDECNAGDVLISKAWKGADDFRVYSARSATVLPPGLRILSRAPKREPWQDLADAINEAGAQMQENIVRALHKRGVRVTDGDDDE